MSVIKGSVEVPELNSRLKRYRVVVLAGGVGGAKLAEGISQHVPPENLTIIGNTGDDFTHLGLKICPDLDTVMYMLAGVHNPETGWGRDDESWRVMSGVKELGGPDWFSLGDLDLSTHLIRSHLLAAGKSLTETTAFLCEKFNVGPKLLPMSDQLAPTIIDTDEGALAFQSWFVEKKWEPTANKVLLPEDVRATAQVVAALTEAEIVIIAPSNPFVSIDPILNVYPIRSMVKDLPKIVVAVTPIIAGEAVKGPAAKMMREMGLPVSASTIAEYYDGLIDLFIYDERDEQQPYLPDLETMQTDTLMKNQEERGRLAHDILSYVLELLET
ncbi:MAG: 2-phospho-L-lactate transferase [Candidatus Promineifilaceae bacterium]